MLGISCLIVFILKYVDRQDLLDVEKEEPILEFWAYQYIFNTFFGKYILEFYLPAMVYNYLIFKMCSFIKKSKEGTSSKKSIYEQLLWAVTSLNHLLIFIYIWAVIHYPNQTLAHEYFMVHIPRLIYILTLLGFFLTYYTFSKKKSS